MRGAAILLFILFFGVQVNAQVSGYMGKRTLASYNLTLAPNAIELLDGEAYELKVSTAHSFGLAYVISRSWTAGLDFSYLSTDTYDEIEDYYGNIIKSDVEVSGKSIGLSFTKYGGNKGKLPAPLGKYFQTRVFVTMLKTVNSLGEPEIVVADDWTYNLTFPGKEIDQFPTVGLALGIGNNIVIKNRIIFNYGGELSYSTIMLEEQVAGFSGEGSLAKYLAADALENSYILTLKAGISGLLF